MEDPRARHRCHIRNGLPWWPSWSPLLWGPEGACDGGLDTVKEEDYSNTVEGPMAGSGLGITPTPEKTGISVWRPSTTSPRVHHPSFSQLQILA